VGAMAWHPERGLLDPYGGREDIGRRIIRAVGSPCERFGEDALRILRAFRFSSSLDFDIEPETLAAAYELCPALAAISAERVTSELKGILCGVRPQLVGDIIKNGGLSPSGGLLLKCGSDAGDALLLSRLPDDFAVRMAGMTWLFCNGAPDALFGCLRLDNKTVYTVRKLLKGMSMPFPANEAAMKRKFSDVPPELWRDILHLREVLNNENVSEIRGMFNNVTGHPWNRFMLAVSGDDVLAAGVPQSRVGKVIAALTERVIKCPEDNRRDVLIELMEDFGGKL